MEELAKNGVIMLLKNKNIIITGCNRGIGANILELFAQHGANIWACSRTYSKEYEDYLNELGKLNNISIWPISRFIFWYIPI